MHPEQLVLRRSIAATLAIAVLGIVFGALSGSFSIIFDGAYSLIDATMSVLALLVSRLIVRDAQGVQRRGRFSVGFWHLEPLVLALNGLLLSTVAVYGFANAVGLILSGGRVLAFDWAIAYAVATLAVCVGMLVYETRANRTLRSDFLALDGRAWAMSGAITAALLVAFVLGGLVEGTPHAWLAPYADPAVLAVVCLVIAPLPIGTIRQALSEILLLAPPGLVEEVEAVAKATAARHGLLGFHAYVAKIGRSRQMEIHFILPPDRPLGDVRTLDAIRDEVGAAIGGESADRWLTITFTGDPEWAR